MPGLYGQYVAYLDGILLANNTSIDTTLETPDEPVVTVVLGFAGVTPGARKRTADFENVCPAAGEDYDFEAAANSCADVELMLQQVGSGKKMVSEGKIQNVKRAGGAGRTAGVSFHFEGTPAIFE